MKKENFYTLIGAVIGGLLFALGMCMCLLTEWNAFTAGVILAAIGGAVLIATFIARRVILGKPALKINPKTVGKIAFGVLGALVLGVGMCMIMVFDMMIWGIVVGLAGIILLLCLIPMCVGLK